MTTHEQLPITAGRMWLDLAACRNADPEAFFPTAVAGPEYEAQVAAAKAICAGCRVRTECLAWALTALPYGIAGGMTEEQRRRQRTGTRRRRRRVPVRAAGAKPQATSAGRDAIRIGGSPRAVAREFGVSERTAQRWATQARVEREQQQTQEGIQG